MIKLYIFGSVEEAIKFERAPIEIVGTPLAIEMAKFKWDPEKTTAAGTERDPIPARRKAKKKSAPPYKKSSDPEKEFFKERIIAKAKAGKARKVETCKLCNEPGHRQKKCPMKAPIKEDPDFATELG